MEFLFPIAPIWFVHCKAKHKMMFKKQLVELYFIKKKEFSKDVPKICFTGDYDIVFVNFYADWCRFSQHLMPIFEEASNRFKVSHFVLLYVVEVVFGCHSRSKSFFFEYI